MTVDVIEPIYNAWKSRYRGLDNWSRKLISSQKHRGHRPHTETWYGRRLYAQTGMEYSLIDYKVQGTAAECLKLAALQVDAGGYGDLLRLPVHDELIAGSACRGRAGRAARGTQILTDHHGRL